VELILSDENGFVVKRKKLKNSKKTIDISNLEASIYYLKILVNDHQIYKTKRIVKK